MSSVVPTRGRPSWAVGVKRDLFEDALPEWQTARDKGDRVVGKFYDNFTKRFIATFGWHFNIWHQKDVPLATPDQWQHINDHTGLTTAEVEKRKAYAKALRTKIMAIFLSHYGKISTTDSPEDISTMFNSLGDAPKAPRRTRMYQYYSHDYFPKRIGKPKMDQLWAAEKTKSVPQGTKRLTRLELTNLVTKAAWEKETPEFREWLTKQRDEEHERLLEAHHQTLKEIDDAPNCPESYHMALANAGAFLQPLADIAAKKFGAAVSILLALPIGSKGGKVELRSIHSGATSTLNPLTWPEFDHEGFNGVQTSFVNFGNHVFTEVQRAERILANNDQSDATLLDDAGTPAASVDDTSSIAAIDTLDTATSLDLSFLDFLEPSSIPEGDSAASIKNADTSLPCGTATLSTTQYDLVLPAASPPPAQNIEALLPNGATSMVHPVPGMLPSTSYSQCDTVFPTPSLQHQVSPVALNRSLSVPPPQLPQPPQPPLRRLATVIEAVHLDDVPQPARTAFAAVLNMADAWGTAWAACVTAFVSLERLHSFDLKEYRLPSSLRPIQYKQWIAAKRPPGWIPSSVDTFTFGTSWLAWWAEIQPPGRVEAQGNTLSTTADGLLWQKLAKTGPSGMFLVLVGLAWWRRLSDVESVEWTNAVLDVEWALQQVMAGSAPAKLVKKRKLDNPVGDVATPPIKKRAPMPSRRALGLQ